jgi:hypothetical protein
MNDYFLREKEINITRLVVTYFQMYKRKSTLRVFHKFNFVER